MRHHATSDSSDVSGIAVRSFGGAFAGLLGAQRLLLLPLRGDR
jgi:hypothetical protein